MIRWIWLFPKSACHLKRETILADKIFGGSVDCNKGRELNPEALLEVGNAQATLLHRYLAMGGWCYEANYRQGPSRAILAHSGEDPGVDVGLGLALDLPIYRWRLARLLRKSEHRDHQEEADRRDGSKFHQIDPPISSLRRLALREYRSIGSLESLKTKLRRFFLACNRKIISGPI